MINYIKTSNVIGGNSTLNFRNTLSSDSKIFENYIKDKFVLDIGCVDMIESIDDYGKFIQSDDFLHKRIFSFSKKVIGVDINETGVRFLNESGFVVLLLDLMFYYWF